MFRQFALLARTNLRAFRAKTLNNLRHSKLMMATLALFLTGYLIIGYWLFARGLQFLYDLPGMGMILVERVLYLLYFFFFIMLIFSNSILLYSGIFRGKETTWLLTLPVHRTSLFAWKAVESLVVSSWGLVILSAPLLLAFGKVLGANGWFYLKCLIVYVPFIVLPAALSAILVMILVRIWGWLGKALLWGGLAWVMWKVASSYLLARDLMGAGEKLSTADTIRQVLSHTEIAAHPLLPSAWMSELIMHWGRGYEARGIFYGLVLVANTLLFGWFGLVFFSHWLYPCYNQSQERKANKAWRRQGRRFAVDAAGLPIFPTHAGFSLRMLGLGRTNAALVRKEVREFCRDPAQWVPCVLLFGLLFLYSANLRRFTFDPSNTFWVALVIFLNFAVCSLSVSTLATRFIFPLFSLEGRRLWILGLAPLSMRRVFYVKLLLFGSAIALITGALMFLSGTRLDLAWTVIWQITGCIVLMSFGLTALSLSLGVLFPNFQEANPSKIVSGFGGTLCLILNFLYILLFLGLFIGSGTVRFTKSATEFQKISPTISLLCFAGMGILTLFGAGLAIFFSLRRIKRLELLGKL